MTKYVEAELFRIVDSEGFEEAKLNDEDTKPYVKTVGTFVFRPGLFGKYKEIITGRKFGSAKLAYGEAEDYRTYPYVKIKNASSTPLIVDKDEVRVIPKGILDYRLSVYRELEKKEMEEHFDNVQKKYVEECAKKKVLAIKSAQTSAHLLGPQR